jgi:hypothetical protein
MGSLSGITGGPGGYRHDTIPLPEPRASATKVEAKQTPRGASPQWAVRASPSGREGSARSIMVASAIDGGFAEVSRPQRGAFGVGRRRYFRAAPLPRFLERFANSRTPLDRWHSLSSPDRTRPARCSVAKFTCPVSDPVECAYGAAPKLIADRLRRSRSVKRQPFEKETARRYPWRLRRLTGWRR